MAYMRKCFAAGILCLMLLVALSPMLAGGDSKQKARENIIKLLRSSKMNKELDGAVTVTADRVGLLCIRDPGNYLTQYIIATPDSKIATDPNVIIDAGVDVPASVTHAVIVTHGWIDKGAKDWPADIAGAIRDKVDPNDMEPGQVYSAIDKLESTIRWHRARYDGRAPKAKEDRLRALRVRARAWEKQDEVAQGAS